MIPGRAWFGGFLIALGLWMAGCSAGNLEDVTVQAPTSWRSLGYEPVGYEGYQWGFGGFGTSYGGAKVWHLVRRPEDPRTIYSGYVIKWGDEYHVYGPWAHNTIVPSRD